jgi:hypothetical protein
MNGKVIVIVPLVVKAVSNTAAGGSNRGFNPSGPVKVCIGGIVVAITTVEFHGSSGYLHRPVITQDMVTNMMNFNYITLWLKKKNSI